MDLIKEQKKMYGEREKCQFHILTAVDRGMQCIKF